MTDVVLTILGLVFLTLGGEWLVQSSVAIARKMNLSILLVSAVVIGFGTSIPDLLVSVKAAWKDSPDIALGNVIGSNIFHVLFVLGIAALITNIPCRTVQVKHNVLICLIAGVILALLSFLEEINRLAGLLLLLALIAYLPYSIWLEKSKSPQSKAENQKRIERVEEDKKMSFVNMALFAAGGLAFLIAGAHLLVEGAVALAHHFGISEAVIGLTLVALGTSLPEMATTLVAAWRRRPDAVIGNILGSNIFNIFGILGITALIKPVPFVGQIAQQDVWIMLATTVLLAPMMLPDRTISRTEGVVLLTLYLGYIIWLYIASS